MLHLTSCDTCQEKKRIDEMNGYWVSYEMENGEIGTWSDYASDADKFIRSLLVRGKGNIKKFIELINDEQKGKSVSINIPVRKYNQWIRQL